MRRAPFFCRCGQIIPHGTTCQCVRKDIRARNARHDRNRPNARQRGYNAQWDQARKEWLHFNPCCEMCGAKANTVDHVQPHRGDQQLFWDKTNWQSLCAFCHNWHKQRLEHRNAPN